MGRGLSCIIVFLILLLSCSIAYANDSPSDISDILTQKPEMGLIKNSNFPSEEVKESVNSDIVYFWPESGYYYVTDYMYLLVITSGDSHCTFSFNSGSSTLMEAKNATYHYYELFDLTDNMASETPYRIDFSCSSDDIVSSLETTYFKINTTPLDSVIRGDLGSLLYLYTYEDRDSFTGLQELYQGYYSNQDETILHNIIVELFDNGGNALAHLQDKVSELNLTLKAIGNRNFYTYTDPEVKGLFWISGNYLILYYTYPWKNTTAVKLNLSVDIINPYTQKYPSTLKIGTCGNSKVDVFNDNGFTEQCDTKSQNQTCGSKIGECKQGIQTRNCNANCTWTSFSACNDTKPKVELCDGKDNNCNNNTDEIFPLGNICFSGVGACKTQGYYVCSANKTNVTCNAVPLNSSKENCNDGIDNDCDGLIDFTDTKDCTSLNISSPVSGYNYSTHGILFNIKTDYNISDLYYNYKDKNNKSINVSLCKKCSSINKTISINDGFYNLTVIVGNKTNLTFQKKISFLVDTIMPAIGLTTPSSGFANGTFSVKFKEVNPKNLTFIYNNISKPLNLQKDCKISLDIGICNFSISLSALDGKNLSYLFNLTGVNGQTDLSKIVRLIVDSTAPKIKYFNYSVNKSSVTFNLTINESNFKAVNYINNSNNSKWNTLCSTLKDDKCNIKKTFSKGYYNLTIQIMDKAGNSAYSKAKFNVNSS